MRIPSAMASPLGSSGGGALMERSKLSLTQKQTSKSPSLEEGGGGGGIGKKIHNGGGGGGDDDDDDEYFEEGDGEDPDDGKWWHRVPLDKLYDAATVRAVLSEWCTTVETLPAFLRMLASMQYYSSAQWVRYLTIQDRPNMFRALERTLARIPEARSAFVGKVLADPAFVQKTGIEAGLAFALSLAHEAHVRGGRIKSELDTVLINCTCMAVAAATCSALVAPSKAPTPPGAVFPWQRMLQSLPSNAFELSTPTRRFAVSQRVSSYLTKGVELSAVYAAAGAASAGLQQCVVVAKASKDPKKRNGQVTPVPGVSRAAGGLGIYGGVAANTRLQVGAGLERVLLEHAKVSTVWQVVALSAVYRGVTLAALENPMGLGPRAVTRCSRAGAAGEPTAHVPSPKPVKRLVRRKVLRKAPAEAPTAPMQPVTA
eukprot:jgi/Ulvmu1/2412/UM133_0013.1